MSPSSTLALLCSCSLHVSSVILFVCVGFCVFVCVLKDLLQNPYLSRLEPKNGFLTVEKGKQVAGYHEEGGG